jgi:hypothetical protein
LLAWAILKNKNESQVRLSLAQGIFNAFGAIPNHPLPAWMPVRLEHGKAGLHCCLHLLRQATDDNFLAGHPVQAFLHLPICFNLQLLLILLQLAWPCGHACLHAITLGFRAFLRSP